MNPKITYKGNRVYDSLFDYHIGKIAEKYKISEADVDTIYDIVSDLIPSIIEMYTEEGDAYVFTDYQRFADAAHNEFYGDWYNEIYDECVKDYRENQNEEDDEEKQRLDEKIEEAYKKGLLEGFTLPD
jgi:hypothetical protein